MPRVQFLTQVALLFWIFFLFWQTFLFRFGLIGQLFWEFPTFFIFALFGVVLHVCERGARLVSHTDSQAFLLSNSGERGIYDL